MMSAIVQTIIGVNMLLVAIGLMFHAFVSEVHYSIRQGERSDSQ